MCVSSGVNGSMEPVGFAYSYNGSHLLYLSPALLLVPVAYIGAPMSHTACSMESQSGHVMSFHPAEAGVLD